MSHHLSADDGKNKAYLHDPRRACHFSDVFNCLKMFKAKAEHLNVFIYISVKKPKPILGRC